MSAIELDLLRRAIIEETKSYLVTTAQYAKTVDDCDSKIAEMDQAIAAKERHIIQLEDLRKKERAMYEKSLNLMELHLMDANRILAKEMKHNQENACDVRMSITRMGDIEREVTERESHMNKCKRFRDILFKMASLMQIEEDAFIQSLTHSSEEGMEVNVSEELMALVTNLSDQNLLQVNATERRKETLDERQTNLKKIQEKGNDQIHDLVLTKLEDMINKDEGRLATLKRLVAFTPSLSVDDDDVEWDTLSRKVTGVYESCMGRNHVCNATEMLCKIEGHVLVLLDQLESLPQDALKTLRRLILADRIKKNTEENLKHQQLRELETKEKCLKRLMSDVKKRTGRKLMLRSMIPDDRKTKDVEERPQTPEEIVWDKETCEKEEKSAVAALWEDWRLAKAEKEAKLAEQCKKKMEEESAAMSHAHIPTRRSNREGSGPKFGAVAFRIPSASTKRPLPRPSRPKLSKTNFTNSSSKEETRITQLQQTCPVCHPFAAASGNELDKPAKVEKPRLDLSTLLRMRRLY
ncbi:uncharacterized protein LOC118124029 [Hippoglossus stenolepis]|uniref:uncharacterized protein LOC118124029 n=1 Tax=Hippoglossus stenolepis TaxID=195615 RepID=UPI001FAFAB7C|nr:uncharacterized protein LOC118124029 [Hippoglossus stenolepis]